MKIELDMYQTLAIAVLVLMLGKFLRERVRLLDKFCIPAPVIGGVLFAIFTCICYVTGVAEFAFDDTLKEVCMVMFFTSVGFQANLKVLKSGGKAMIVFLGVVIVLIVSQNFLAVGLANLLGVLMAINGVLDIGNFLGRFAIWILIALCISIYSNSAIRASINVFVFFVGMVASYYLYSNYIAGFFPRSYAMIWFGFTAVSPLLAFVCSGCVSSCAAPAVSVVSAAPVVSSEGSALRAGFT